MREDLGKRGDITSRATVPSDLKGEAVIVSRGNGIIAGQRIAEAVFNYFKEKVDYQVLVEDGEQVEAGSEIARLNGKLWMILAGERTALNLLGRCSGIATFTAAFVSAVAGTEVKITETRKTAPGLRYLDKASVLTGGGVNHRYALYDAFLIKENHIVAAGSIVEAIEACHRHREKYGKFRIMVEADTVEAFKSAVTASPDRILLDNMNPEQLRECVNVSHGNIELEATGNIHLDNVRKYAETGVDYISIGALTHSVKALDLSLLALG